MSDETKKEITFEQLKESAKRVATAPDFFKALYNEQFSNEFTTIQKQIAEALAFLYRCCKKQEIDKSYAVRRYNELEKFYERQMIK